MPIRLKKITRYQVEPYIVAADIYGVSPHTGSGGWTWYTGSSGWMYRLGIEAILGICRIGDILRINPCIPRHWSGFKLAYKVGTNYYCITVVNPHGVNQGIKEIFLDGQILPGKEIPLSKTHADHEVRIVMGGSPEPALTGEMLPTLP